MEDRVSQLRTDALFVLAFLLIAQSLLNAQSKSFAASHQEQVIPVPFVGCKSDGQVGPLEAPHGKSKMVAITAEASKKLAYYQAEHGVGVLAPRGWYCFGTYGSAGSTLYVAPQPFGAAELFSDKWNGFAGPAIELNSEIGDTSGRFEVARTIARVFPAHKAFVRDVIAEGIEPASSFSFGPYPHDRLLYRNKETVEYQTPAEEDGLGTESYLQKNASAIKGAAILLGEKLDLLFLAARLPQDMDDLMPVIVLQVESDSKHPDQ
jgi:hypothetical protein